MTEQRSAQSSLAPGMRLGPYEIKAPIGAGGMGGAQGAEPDPN